MKRVTSRTKRTKSQNTADRKPLRPMSSRELKRMRGSLRGVDTTVHRERSRLINYPICAMALMNSEKSFPLRAA